jgi:hypothetical protein
MMTPPAPANEQRKGGRSRVEVTPSLPRPLMEAAWAEVRAGHASSLSTFVAAALAERLERHNLEHVLGEMDLAYGPPTPEDEAWARRVLGL